MCLLPTMFAARACFSPECSDSDVPRASLPPGTGSPRFTDEKFQPTNEKSRPMNRKFQLMNGKFRLISRKFRLYYRSADRPMGSPAARSKNPLKIKPPGMRAALAWADGRSSVRPSGQSRQGFADDGLGLILDRFMLMSLQTILVPDYLAIQLVDQ